MTSNPVERWRIMARSIERDKRPPVVNAASSTTPATAKMYLYDAIDPWGGPFGISAREFIDQLNALGDVNSIELHINSPGGDVYDGIAIRNALRQHDATVTTVVDGLAASAASFIAVAGDEVVVAANAELMIHNAWGLAMGNSSDLRDLADRLDHHDANIAAMYVAKAGGEVSDWLAAMAAETWYSASEAIDAGLADRSDDSASAAAEDAKARYDLSVFNYAGRAKAPAPVLNGSPTQTPAAASADGKTKEGSLIVAFSDESIATLRQKLGVPEDADEGTILSALDEALNERAEPQNNAAQLPEGVVTIDEAQLSELRAHAEAGRQARLQQEQEARERIVDQAISDGRITPARRSAWLNRLAADPEEVQTLNSLEKGLVPVNEVGHAGGSDELTEDTDAYPAHWKR